MLKIFGYPLFWYRQFRDRIENKMQQQIVGALKQDEAENNRHVLIGIMNFAGTKLTAEMAFARYFYKKGYTVDIFTCNGECACCVPKLDPKLRSAYCQACTLKSRDLEKLYAGKVNFLKVSDFVSKAELAEIKKAVAEREFKKREDFVWKGIDSHDSIWYGIMRVDLKSFVNYDNDLGNIRRFAVSAFALSEALQKYFIRNSEKMQGSIVSHGMYHLYGPFLDAANHCGVQGAYWNGAYMRPHTVYFGLNKHIFTAGIFENPENSNRENFMKKKNSKINYMITKIAYNKNNIIHFFL